MLEGIVRHQKKFLLILAAILMVVFLIGPSIPTFFGGLAGPRHAGLIFGEKVSLKEFADAHARMVRFSPRDRTISPEEVWDRLCRLKLARKLGIRVSDQEVREHIIEELKAAYGENSVTDETYGRFLKDSYLTAEQYEGTVRENLVLRKLLVFLSSSIKVTSEEVWRDYKREHDSFKVTYIEIPFKLFVDEIPPVTEKEIQFYYDENKEEFRMPETIKVGYYAALAKDFEQEVRITDEMVRQYYEENRERYRITPASEEEPPDAAEQEAQYRPLEKARDEIEKTLRSEAARDLAQDALWDLLIGIDEKKKTKEEVLKENPLVSYQQTDYFSRAEAGGLEHIGSSRSGNTSFAEIVFELEDGALSSTASSPDGSFAFEILDRKPSYIPPLEDVSERIVEKLKDINVNRTALTKANEISKKLSGSGGEPKELLKSEKGIKAVTADKFYARTDFSTPFPSGVLDLEMNTWSRPLPKGDAYYVAKVVEKKDASRAEFEKEKERRTQTLLWQKRFRYMYGEFQRDVMRRAELQDNTAELFGNEDSEQ
jgi:peptidyl-prolyl cis-trans isomerase D